MANKFDIENFAHLSRLSLTEEEKDVLQKDIESILEMVGTLAEVDLSEIEETINERLAPNYMKKDVAIHTHTVDEVCKTMPEIEDNSLKVPQIIEE